MEEAKLDLNTEKKGDIILSLKDEERVCVISKKGFFWRGEKLEDIKNIYDAMLAFLDSATVTLGDEVILKETNK